jgi:hypothetical protein
MLFFTSILNPPKVSSSSSVRLSPCCSAVQGALASVLVDHSPSLALILRSQNRLEPSTSVMARETATLAAEVEGSELAEVQTFEELALCKEAARPEWVGEVNSRVTPYTLVL